MKKYYIIFIEVNMKIKVEVSNRHIHLSKEICESLFGKKFKLTVKRELSQEGEFASNSTLSLKAKKGIIENVRIVGPLRDYTQVELSRSDAKILGINPPVRNSGDLIDSESIILIGPKKEIKVDNCVIIAARHLHINNIEAKKNHLINDQIINLTINNKIMNDIHVKIGKNYTTALHVDKDDEKEYEITLDTYTNYNKISRKKLYITSIVSLTLVIIFTIFLFIILRALVNYLNSI
jgi:propanediol utilization protein